MGELANPGYDADMLRRAATAAANIQKQAVGSKEWFDWVPAWLEGLADRLGPPRLGEGDK